MWVAFNFFKLSSWTGTYSLLIGLFQQEQEKEMIPGVQTKGTSQQPYQPEEEGEMIIKLK